MSTLHLHVCKGQCKVWDMNATMPDKKKKMYSHRGLQDWHVHINEYRVNSTSSFECYFWPRVNKPNSECSDLVQSQIVQDQNPVITGLICRGHIPLTFYKTNSSPSLFNRIIVFFTVF